MHSLKNSRHNYTGQDFKPLKHKSQLLQTTLWFFLFVFFFTENNASQLMKIFNPFFSLKDNNINFRKSSTTDLLSTLKVDINLGRIPSQKERYLADF